MRWKGQELDVVDHDALPGMRAMSNLVRTVTTPEFAGVMFHEVLAKSALNHVPGSSTALPFGWTINPYRGCSHACTFCFARNTHTYLDFDAGAQFDSQIVVKVNVVDVLQKELAKPSWQHPHVALGTNTDPYQRAEGRYRLMPGIIAALAASGTPFSILTKGTLLRRDLPLLAEAAERVPVQIAMTIDVAEPELRASVEPGAPTAEGRLATVRAAADLGFDVSVLVMPVLPYLTDSIAHLDKLLGMIADAGATQVAYSALHLRTGAREWYLAWLERAHPELLPRYREMYGRSAYAPKEYRAWLAQRIRPLLRKHGLERQPRMDPSTGTPIPVERPRFGRVGDGAEFTTGHEMPATGLIAAELPPAVAAAVQPTLF